MRPAAVGGLVLLLKLFNLVIRAYDKKYVFSPYYLVGLRRNLYLISQIIEAGLPVVVALNMIDVAAARGIEIDADRLTADLGVPVVPICAHRRQGVEQLRRTLAATLADRRQPAPPSRPQFPEALLREIAALKNDSLFSANGHSAPLSDIEALRALGNLCSHLR